MPLSEAQIRRYSRHILLPDLGGTGQARLLAARVAVDCSTAAGAVTATYLAAAGVGTLELSGAPDTLLARLHALNPDVSLTKGATLDQNFTPREVAVHGTALVEGGREAVRIILGIVKS